MFTIKHYELQKSMPSKVDRQKHVEIKKSLHCTNEWKNKSCNYKDAQTIRNYPQWGTNWKMPSGTVKYENQKC